MERSQVSLEGTTAQYRSSEVMVLWVLNNAGKLSRVVTQYSRTQRARSIAVSPTPVPPGGETVSRSVGKKCTIEAGLGTLTVE
jgi:hypothetical protein